MALTRLPLVSGLIATSIKTVAYTAMVNDLVRVNSAAGAFTVTLPAAPAGGDKVGIFDITNSCLTNAVLIAASGGKTVENDTDGLSVNVNGAFVQLLFTGTNWKVLETPLIGMFQDTLVSGTNIKTVNGTPILGSGNVAVAGLTANTFTAAQEWATGTNIASAATINLDTLTGNRVHITGITTITAVTLTRGPRTVIFDGVLTLAHNATTNNLPGAANITTAVGDRAIYESDGTTVYCVSYIRASGAGVVSAGSGDHEIKVRTGNGAGSTSTKWRRFTTTENSIGTAITYADSAAAGATFTIAANQGGLYQIIYGDVGSAGGGYNMGISVNSNQGTTSYFSITAVHRRTQSLSTGGFQGACGGVFSLNAGDIVRAHMGDSAAETASIDAFLYIRKVGNL